MKRFYILALVATMFAACTTDETQDLRPVDAPETLTVGFEGGDDNTRIQLNSAGKTVWTKGDLVSVFYRSDANQKWQFQGETGERVGNLKRVSAGSATETMKRVVVVYPYNENYYINTDTYNVQAFLPATQHYLADSYGLDGNIMISVGEYNQFSLKNVCGWLKLQLTGAGEKIKSISINGNNGEQVAGEIYINSADATAILAAENGTADDSENGAGGSLIFDDTILTKVKLDCGDGVTLGAEATAFYIALPPQTFEKGVTVEITTTEGKIMGQYTDKEIVIERNTIQPMTELSFEEKIAANQIHYTSNDDTVVTPYKTDVFGANIVSNVCENGKGIITFDNKVTSIGNRAFDGCTSLTSVTIPDSVTSIGNYAFQDCDSLTSVTIPDSVTSIGEHAFSDCTSLKAFYGKLASEDNRCLIVNGVLNSFAIGCGATEYTIPEGVISIGAWAFYDCTSLTSITIPDSVTSIGSSAFSGCYSLTSVTIPDSVTSIGGHAFHRCKSLTSVTIPDSVTSIETAAFGDCTSLTSVTIPDSVTSIGGSAFQDCTSLKEVYCKPTTPPTGGYYMFSYYDGNGSFLPIGCKIYVPTSDDDSIINAYKAKQYWSEYESDIYEYNFIPNNEIWYTATEKIEPYKAGAFVGTHITSNTWDATTNKGVIICDGTITEIADYAFAYTAKLTSITIPDSVVSIGNSAFNQCSDLTSVVLPLGITKISDSMFFDCVNLTDVSIPNNVTSIEQYAFGRCESLTDITIPNSVTEIGNRAFAECASLKRFNGKFAVDNGRCLIKDETLIAYAEASGTEYEIPANVTTIGKNAFYYCRSLTNIIIPNGITTIESSAFQGCRMSSVTIPESVTSIKSEAFFSCNLLSSVYCKSTTPPIIYDIGTFDYNADGRKFYVPASDDDSIINAYKTKWGSYASYIEEYDFSAGQ